MSINRHKDNKNTIKPVQYQLNNRMISSPLTTSTISSPTYTTYSPMSNPYSYQQNIIYNNNQRLSYINESEDIAYNEKRSAHNALERQRREGLNIKFQELAHVLPSLRQVRRPSKSMIVAKSLEFVSKAGERENSYQDQIDQLKRENEQLMKQAQLSDRKKKLKKTIEPTIKEEAATTPVIKSEVKLTKKKSREEVKIEKFDVKEKEKMTKQEQEQETIKTVQPVASTSKKRKRSPAETKAEDVITPIFKKAMTSIHQQEQELLLNNITSTNNLDSLFLDPLNDYYLDPMLQTDSNNNLSLTNPNNTPSNLLEAYLQSVMPDEFFHWP